MVFVVLLHVQCHQVQHPINCLLREVSLLIVLEIYLLSSTITIEFKSFVYQQISVIVKQKATIRYFHFII